MSYNRYEISDRYSEQKKIDFLIKRGFDVKKEKESFWRSVYHNNTEEWEEDIWKVFDKDKKPYPYLFTNPSTKDAWLNTAFEEELYKKLLE